jgi:CrcB protein
VSTVLVVALGSGLGGAARYLLGLLLQRPGIGFPVATLAINVLGSFALGLVLRLGLDPTAMTPATRAFLTAGVCGGFTTFSTFSAESLALLEQGAWGRGLAYMIGSVVLSVGAAAIGYGIPGRG